MNRFIKALILLSLLLALPVWVQAQEEDLTQVIDLGKGYSISVPEDWEVTEEDDGAFSLGGVDIVLWVVTPSRLRAGGVTATADDDLVDALVDTLDTFDGLQVDRRDVVMQRFDGRSAAIFTLSETRYDEMDVLLEMSDGRLGLLTFLVGRGDLEDQMELIEAIIATFDNATPDVDVAAQTEGATCTVSADGDDSAQLRVGPGTNRGAISFLPAGIDVTVTGRIELDDGSVWYQLDKAQAAPNGTAAAELWVLAEDVSESGDCEHVGDTAAPPVIPIVAAPPTAVPGGGGGGGGSPQAGALPSSGSWVLNLNATTNASCLGGPNVPIASSEIFESLTQTYAVSIRDNSTFIYGGDLFTRIPNTNSFEGSFTFEDGTNSQIRFDLISARSMSGYGTVNFTIDGTPCSATITFVTNHR